MSNALELALEALEAYSVGKLGADKAIYAIKEAIKEAANAQGEPVGAVVIHNGEKLGMLRDKTIEAGAMLYTQAPTIPAPSAEAMSELDNVHELIAKISGSALLAGENCPDRDKAALYGIACEALVAVGYARTLLSAAPKPGEPP